MNRWGWLSVAALAGLVLGAGAAWFTRPAPLVFGPATESGASIGEIRPDFRHAGLDGSYIQASDFDGQALLVNFWATWCAPCVREMPLLQETAQRHDGRLAVVGIAIDEPGGVRAFVEELGITYPIAIGTSDVMDTQRAWGNVAGVLPYTVLVDAEGVIRWQHLGEVTEADLEAVLAEWL